ncbi:MAG: hypothetical protein K2Q27_16420 [Novosphingobium sp.]|uniref:hypothetical protein n=1 Tax=Novosphingobium sp. NDB2Meth1 TaxID=1892847 RepID=UPI0011608277|nr:hypothetical protein [Novosphingobium sp. NDB2Meth1]MBY0394838.1 hypothetical protein [Novosphingobium sp.]
MLAVVAQDYHGTNRTDDPAIVDDSRLLRHCRTPVQIVRCEINGFKVSDQAFKLKSGDVGASVDLECLLLQDGLPPDHRFGVMPNTYALIAISAKSAREFASGAAWTPKPLEPDLIGAAREANPWHGEIIGPITNSASRSLASSATTIRRVPIDQYPPK